MQKRSFERKAALLPPFFNSPEKALRHFLGVSGVEAQILAGRRRERVRYSEDFTHQFIGGAFSGLIFSGAAIMSCICKRSQFKTAWRWNGVQSRCFIEEQQAARRDIFTAQAARFIFPALYHHHQNRHTGTTASPVDNAPDSARNQPSEPRLTLNFHFQIVAVIQQFFTDGLRRAPPHINLRVKTLIQFRQRFWRRSGGCVKQILMLLVLSREHIQQHGVRFTYVHVQCTLFTPQTIRSKTPG